MASTEAFEFQISQNVAKSMTSLTIASCGDDSLLLAVCLSRQLKLGPFIYEFIHHQRNCGHQTGSVMKEASVKADCLAIVCTHISC